jgi:hypothetical protein
MLTPETTESPSLVPSLFPRHTPQSLDPSMPALLLLSGLVWEKSGLNNNYDNISQVLSLCQPCYIH